MREIFHGLLRNPRTGTYCVARWTESPFGNICTHVRWGVTFDEVKPAREAIRREETEFRDEEGTRPVAAMEEVFGVEWREQIDTARRRNW